MINNDEAVQELKDLADAILYHKRHRRRRPIVIEFAGSPKSGKSSCCGALDLFLRRNGFNTSVISERSHFAKIKDKHDPIFNIWTLSSTIAELAETLGTSCKSSSPDAILIDRGLFDALCWFDWLNKSNKLNDIDYDNFKNFILSPKWLDMIDLVFVFTAEPKDSIGREFSGLLTNIRGSIMEENTLDQINNSIKNCMTMYGENFKALNTISTSKSNKLQDFNYKVTKTVLTTLGRGVEEKIAFINKKHLDYKLPKIFKIQEAGLSITNIEFDERNKVEEDVNKIQLVPICVIIDKKRNLILSGRKSKIAAKSGNPEHEKLLIYFGGHVRLEDFPNIKNQTLVSMLDKAVTRELKEELDITLYPSFNISSKAIWVRNGSKSDQHLAICTIIDVDSSRFGFQSDALEFSNDDGFKIAFRKIENIAKNVFEIEEWGYTILTSIGKVDVSNYLSGLQLPLFDDEN